MSTHTAVISWSRTSPDYTYASYNRAHTWVTGSGHEIAASSAPEFRGDADRVNPEEAFVAALASCHMLTFLAIAAKAGITVDRYEDAAEGVLTKQDGTLSITRVVLRPRIRFGGEPPSVEALAHLHEQAHRGCFIANSVKTVVTVE